MVSSVSVLLVGDGNVGGFVSGDAEQVFEGDCEADIALRVGEKTILGVKVKGHVSVPVCLPGSHSQKIGE